VGSQQHSVGQLLESHQPLSVVPGDGTEVWGEYI
jgi:hypothetical protein